MGDEFLEEFPQRDPFRAPLPAQLEDPDDWLPVVVPTRTACYGRKPGAADVVLVVAAGPGAEDGLDVQGRRTGLPSKTSTRGASLAVCTTCRALNDMAVRK